MTYGGEVILEVVFMVNTCPLSACKLEIKCRKTCSTIRTQSCFVYRFSKVKNQQFVLFNPSIFLKTIFCQFIQIKTKLKTLVFSIFLERLTDLLSGCKLIPNFQTEFRVGHDQMKVLVQIHASKLVPTIQFNISRV